MASIRFNCPHCNALYSVTKVEVEPEAVNRQVTCRACGGPMPGRDGIFVRKYLLLREPSRRDERPLRRRRR